MEADKKENSPDVVNEPNQVEKEVVEIKDVPSTPPPTPSTPTLSTTLNIGTETYEYNDSTGEISTKEDSPSPQEPISAPNESVIPMKTYVPPATERSPSPSEDESVIPMKTYVPPAKERSPSPSEDSLSPIELLPAAEELSIPLTVDLGASLTPEQDEHVEDDSLPTEQDAESLKVSFCGVRDDSPLLEEKDYSFIEKEDCPVPEKEISPLLEIDESPQIDNEITLMKSADQCTDEDSLARSVEEEIIVEDKVNIVEDTMKTIQPTFITEVDDHVEATEKETAAVESDILPKYEEAPKEFCINTAPPKNDEEMPEIPVVAIVAVVIAIIVGLYFKMC